MTNYKYWLCVFLIGIITGILVRMSEIILFLSTHYGYGMNGVNTIWY